MRQNQADDAHPAAYRAMTHKRNTGQPHQSHLLLPALIGAASIAGLLASAGIAMAGDFSSRSVAAAVFYGVGTLVALAGIIWSSTHAGRLVVLAAVTAGTATVLLLGILSFGPLYLPALVFWGSAGLVLWREDRPPRLLMATGAIWGVGVVLVGSIAILTLI